MNSDTRSKRIATLAGMLILAASPAAANDYADPIRIEDGSSLHFREDGSMRMLDEEGRLVPMQDGEIMLTEDGDEIMMLNHKIWTPRYRHRKPDADRSSESE